MARLRALLKRRAHLAFVTLIVTAGSALLVMPAVALDLTVFELDGNAVTGHSGTGIPDDWDRVCHQKLTTDCSTTNDSNATAIAFASQPASGGDQFSGGGSKDPLPIEGWLWNTSGGLPGKDILLNGFAARYTTSPSSNCPGSSSVGKCSQIFFGMDRFDNSGDAQNGFWFLQNAIAANGSASGSSFKFTCTVPGGGAASPCHTLGDLLIVSDFSIGGGTSTITVYEWDPACTAAGKPDATCGDTNLRQISPTATNARCDLIGSTAAFCGIVNPTNGTTAPWSYTDKSGNTTFLQGEFYEGGIDLSNFPSIANECFASTLAESRSSTSTSATLKSFIVGNFGACTTTVTTQSTPATSEQIGTGSLGAPASDTANITVSGAANWSGSLQFYLCGPSASSCDASGTAIGSAITVTQATSMPVSSSSTTVTSVGSYCWAAFFTSSTTGVPNGRDTGANECFTVTPVTPTLGTTAGAGPVLLGNPVTDTASLTGTAFRPATPVIGGTMTAPADGTITFTLYGPNSCTRQATGTGTNPQTKSVSGDGSYGPVSFTPDAVGTYHWVATYDGSSPNTNGTSHNTSCNDTGEDVTVNQIGTTTVTAPVDGSGASVTSTTFGSSVFDSAVVTAASTGGPAVTGTVAFSVCNPTQLTNGKCALGTGTAVGTAVNLTPTNGASPPSSTATSNASVTANMTGTWCFNATYTPDTNAYTGSSDATIDECFTVTDTSGATSGQTWLPNDSATIATAHGAPLNGTLTLQLYDGSLDCTIGAVGSQFYTKTLTNASSPQTISSNNSTYQVSATDNISWKVTFTSSDSNVGSSSHCESTNLTITN